MKIKTISDFRTAIRNGPYAWPGGYPTYFVMHDGSAISFEAMNRHRMMALVALRDKNSNDAYENCWLPVALEINYEDAWLYCDVTGKRIESAYAEDERKTDDD